MFPNYEVFMEDIKKELIEGKEIVITIKDLTPGPRKYENRVVKAILLKLSDKIPQRNILQVRSWNGKLYSKMWALKIVDELGELLPGIPHGETLLKIKNG